MKKWKFTHICLLFSLLVLTIPAQGQNLPALPFSFSQEYGELTDADIASLDLRKPQSGSLPVAVLWLRPAAGYHTYAHNPGSPDSFPTVLALNGVDNAHYQVRYMRGMRKPDVFDPSVAVWAYPEATPVFFLFLDGTVPRGVDIAASLLACSAINCVPVRQTLPLAAPPGELPDAAAQPWYTDLMQSIPGNPAQLPAAPSVTVTGYEAVSVFGDNEGDSSAALSRLPGGAPRTSVFAAKDDDEPEAGALAPAATSPPFASWDFLPQTFQASLEVSGLGKALLFGLLAGLILNVMPCVLPVLTLKLSAFLAGEGSAEARRRAFREHNLFFSAGILTWFTALAMLFGLAGMAWGQLFQNSAVVFALLLLVFCLGLCMFDVFHLPVLDLRVGTSGDTRAQAYSAGLLATLLATPCSGPLLGGVLSWSLMQSMPVLFTVFIATGLGMASPYLLMSWKPALANRLPRPGAWMQTFERVLGFFLMATAVYLLSILPSAMLIPALASLLVAALAAWIWGKWGSLRASGLRRILIGGTCLVAVGLSVGLVFAPAEEGVAWLTYDRGDFAARMGRENLLLEFTADWCPTCKVLEHTTLSPENLLPLAKKYNLTLIRADMTGFDPELQALQRALDSASIPLLAVFPKGEDWRRPVILRDLYSKEQMTGAIQQALTE